MKKGNKRKKEAHCGKGEKKKKKECNMGRGNIF